MNEIFPRLVCYGQKLIFCSEIETKINTNSVKGSVEDEIGTIFLKNGSYIAQVFYYTIYIQKTL